MNVLPTSTSVVENPPTTVPEGWFSGMVAAESAMSVGAAFGDVFEIFAGTPAIDRPPPTALRQWLGVLRSPRRLLRCLASPRRTAAELRARRTVDPRETFESHEWMWDAESAGDLLRGAGFREVRRASWDTSAIEGWDRFDLDRSHTQDRAWEPATILEAVRT